MFQDLFGGRHSVLRCAAVGLAIASSACMSEAEPSETAPAELPILNGTPNSGKPAIGLLSTKFGSCTATLISSRVIVTAAHCFGFDNTQSGLGSPPDFANKTTGASFRLDSGASFNVTKFSVLGTGIGEADLAVAQLESDVDSSQATPIPLASSAPTNGASVSAWGYGCTEGHVVENGPCLVPPGGGAPFFCANRGTCSPSADQNTQPGGTCLTFISSAANAHTGPCVLKTGSSGFFCGADQMCLLSADQDTQPGGECYRLPAFAPATKRSRTVTWNAPNSRTATAVTCPGDSGGPILNASGAIIAINSAGSGDGAGSADSPGNAVAHRGFIDRLNAAYGNGVACETCAKVNIRTNDGAHYIQAVDNGGSSVNATPTEAGTWETFRVVPLGSGFFPVVGFQTDRGNWLSAENGGGDTVVANRTQAGAWEAFYFVPNGSDFNLATFSGANGDAAYVVAEGAGGGDVNANRTSAGAWETFTLTNVSSALPD